jgi:hypothetical protein
MNCPYCNKIFTSSLCKDDNHSFFYFSNENFYLRDSKCKLIIHAFKPYKSDETDYFISYSERIIYIDSFKVEDSYKTLQKYLKLLVFA